MDACAEAELQALLDAELPDSPAALTSNVHMDQALIRVSAHTGRDASLAHVPRTPQKAPRLRTRVKKAPSPSQAETASLQCTHYPSEASAVCSRTVDAQSAIPCVPVSPAGMYMTPGMSTAPAPRTHSRAPVRKKPSAVCTSQPARIGPHRQALPRPVDIVVSPCDVAPTPVAPVQRRRTPVSSASRLPSCPSACPHAAPVTPSQPASSLDYLTELFPAPDAHRPCSLVSDGHFSQRSPPHASYHTPRPQPQGQGTAGCGLKSLFPPQRLVSATRASSSLSSGTSADMSADGATLSAAPSPGNLQPSTVARAFETLSLQPSAPPTALGGSNAAMPLWAAAMTTACPAVSQDAEMADAWEE